MAKNSVISQQQKPLTKKQQRFFKNIRIIINNTAKKYDQIWRRRSRKIDSKFLINFILNILSSKNQGYAIILNKMWNVYISKNIEFPQAKVFSQSSLCEARQKLPEEIFKDLNSNLIKEFEKDKTKSFLIENHRIFAVDGSKVTLPKNLENENYKVNNQGAHYPKGLLSCIYNLKNYIAKIWTSSSKAESSKEMSFSIRKPIRVWASRCLSRITFPQKKQLCLRREPRCSLSHLRTYVGNDITQWLHSQ